MEKIESIALSDMHQGESFSYHTSVYGVIKGETSPALLSAIALYGSSIENYDVSLNQQRESPYTIELTAANERNDRAWRGFRAANKVNLEHFDRLMVKSAHAIDIVIRSYGDPTALSYPNQMSAIYNLCQDLETDENATHIIETGLTEWYKEMKTANEAFKTLFEKRGDEQSSLISGFSREARKAVENAYRDMTTKFNAVLLLDPTPELADKAERINYYVGYYRNIIATRQGRAAARREKEKGKDMADADDRNDGE